MCFGSPLTDPGQIAAWKSGGAIGLSSYKAQQKALADAPPTPASQIPLLPSPAPNPNASYLGRAMPTIPAPGSSPAGGVMPAKNPYVIPLIQK